MKNLLVLFFVSGWLTTFCQVEKGTLMLGGSAGISSKITRVSLIGSDTETKVKSASVAPTMGIFVADRFVTGLTVSFSNSTIYESSNDIEARSTTFGVGPFFRYYFSLTENVFAFPAASYLFESYYIRSEAFDPVTGARFEESTKTTSSSINVGAGLSYFINNSIGLEGILNYKGYNSEGTNTSSTLSFNIGLQIYFPRN